MKPNATKAVIGFAIGFQLAFGSLLSTPAAADELNVDINSFEEFTPEIQEVDPNAGARRNTGLEEIEVKPIELDQQTGFQFEEYRPDQPAPTVVEEQPAVVEEIAAEPEPVPLEPEPAPIVDAPIQTPMPMAQPTPAPVPVAPVAAPATPTVRMIDRGPVLPEAAPTPLIPVEAPPERQRLRVPEEVQLADSYRPESLDFAVDENYEQELAALQKQLALLRERVIETKSRIITYGERVARGYTSGTRLVMNNENVLGSDFIVESITYYLDGHQVYAKKFDGETPDAQLTVYKGSVLPGKHKVDLEVVLRGDSGMFDFSHSAKLKLTTSEYVTANEGKQLNLKVRMFDKGGFFADIEERPGISFEVSEEDAY